MQFKNVLLLLFVLSFGHLLRSQSVTTLINDANRTFEAIHWHEDGRIYTVDYNNGRLYQVYIDGTIETIATGFSNLAGGGFDQEGVFYFSDLTAGTLHRLNQDGTTTQIATGLNQPTGILGGNDPDLLYVGQYGNNSVAQVSSSTGTVTSWVSNNGINGPDGVIYAADGSLLVANFNNNRISRVSLAGEVSLFATLPATGFMGYIARAGTDIYVPSIAGNRIYRIKSDGNATVFAGTGSTGHTDGTGTMATFTDPNGICSNPTGDTLLVTDGNRIRMITQLPPVRTHELTTRLHGFNISPNPAPTIITVSFQLDSPQQLQWRILTPQGQLIKTAGLTAMPAGPHTLKIPVDSLLPGVYHLQWADQHGNSMSLPFIKS